MHRLTVVVVGLLCACVAAIPSNVRIQRTSSNAVTLSWRQDSNQRLKGYTIHYHNGDGYNTEWKTVYVWEPYATKAVIDNLNSVGEYSFCVRSIMDGMVCACSDLVHIDMATGEAPADRTPQPQTREPYVDDRSVHSIQVGAVGGDFVQLRWRYDGRKPATYVLNYRGFQFYEDAYGRLNQREVDIGQPVELTTEEHVAENLRPDTKYIFEISVVDEEGKPLGRMQSVETMTKSYIA